jgi:GTP1/Obg family GTP-binding protein
MKKINLKMKSVEKAKKMAEAAEKAKGKAVEKARKAAKSKAVKGSKTVKKPRAKKLVGGSPRINDLVKVYMTYNEQLIDEAISGYDNNKDSNAFVSKLSYIKLDGEETNTATNIMRLLMGNVTDDNINSLYNSMKALKKSYMSLN